MDFVSCGRVRLHFREWSGHGEKSAPFCMGLFPSAGPFRTLPPQLSLNILTFAWSHTPNHFGPLSVLRSLLDPWRGLRRVSRFSARKLAIEAAFCVFFAYIISGVQEIREIAHRDWFCFSRDILEKSSTRQPRKLFFLCWPPWVTQVFGTLELIRPTGSLHQSSIPLWAYQVSSYPLDGVWAIPAATANPVLRLDHNYWSLATGLALFSSHHNSLFNLSSTHTPTHTLSLSCPGKSPHTPFLQIFIACLQPPIMRHWMHPMGQHWRGSLIIACVTPTTTKSLFVLHTNSIATHQRAQWRLHLLLDHPPSSPAVPFGPKTLVTPSLLSTLLLTTPMPNSVLICPRLSPNCLLSLVRSLRSSLSTLCAVVFAWISPMSTLPRL